MARSVVRPRQPALTGLLPHPGNKLYAIPRRPAVPGIHFFDTAGTAFYNATASFAAGAYTLSGWFNNEAASGVETMFYNSHTGAIITRNNSRKQVSNLLRSTIFSTVGSPLQRVDSSVLVVTGVLIHYAVALDTTLRVAQCFINGVDVSAIVSDNAGTAFAGTDQAMLMRGDQTDPYIGEFGAVWLDDSFVDLTGGGIEKFYNPAGGLPADLGPRGERPTGSIPKVYMGGDLTANTGGAVGAGPGLNGGGNNGTITTFTTTTGVFTDA